MCTTEGLWWLFLTPKLAVTCACLWVFKIVGFRPPFLPFVWHCTLAFFRSSSLYWCYNRGQHTPKRLWKSSWCSNSSPPPKVSSPISGRPWNSRRKCICLMAAVVPWFLYESRTLMFSVFTPLQLCRKGRHAKVVEILAWNEENILTVPHAEFYFLQWAFPPLLQHQ